MICHEENGKFRFEREDWKEWFRFVLDLRLLKDRNFGRTIKLPRFYFATHAIPYRNVAWFWIAPLAPFVWVWINLWLRWQRLAGICMKKGLVGWVNPNSVVRWYWPIHIPKTFAFKLWFWPARFLFNYNRFTKDETGQKVKRLNPKPFLGFFLRPPEGGGLSWNWLKYVRRQ